MTSVERPEPLEGYERFFGLAEAPFGLAPNPRFLFASAAHAAALAQVAYALERREPVVVITGEIGTGKTLLCRTVVQRLTRQTFLSVIADPRLDGDDLLMQLLQDFGVISKDGTRRPSVNRHTLVQTLQAFLTSLVPIQAHAVVIIDEAQQVQPDVLEQIRLLANLDDARGTLLQIILVGQTDLDRVLAQPELRQLQQRVSRRFQLQPLTADEVAHYIAHRLALASAPPSQAPGAEELARALAQWNDGRAGANAGVTFTPDALQAVATLTGGLPRVINLLCDRALEAAYARRLRIIDPPLINTAADALGLARGAAPTVSQTNHTPPEPDEGSQTLVPLEPAAPDDRFSLADEVVPVAVTVHDRPATATRLRASLVATVLVAAAGGIWWGVRAAKPPMAPTPPAHTVAPASPAVTAPSARPDPVPADPAPASGPAPTTTDTPTPAAVTASDPLATAAPTNERVQIVVASFRTDARAAAVAADVAALGLPARRRTSDDWQQVLAGPFASRAEAEDAQQRLDRAGFTGTQIVATAP